MRSPGHGPRYAPSPQFNLDQNAPSLGASGVNIATFGVIIMASVHGIPNTICLCGPGVHSATPRNLDGLAMDLVTSGPPLCVIVSSPQDFLAVAANGIHATCTTTLTFLSTATHSVTYTISTSIVQTTTCEGRSSALTEVRLGGGR